MSENNVPSEIMKILTGYRMSFFTKPTTRENGSFRPIGPQSILYRIIGACHVGQYTPQHMHAVSKYQQAIGTKNGLETISNHISADMEHHSQNHITLCFDISNGFGAVPRAEVWKTIKDSKMLDHLKGIFLAAYGQENTVQFRLNDKNVSTKMFEGLIQGDPLSSLLFCILFGPILRDTNAHLDDLDPRMTTMFLDDGQMTGTPRKVLEMLKIFVPRAKQLGFKFALNKTSAYAKSNLIYDQNSNIMKDIATILNSGSITLCADDNSDVRTQGINVLGVPIGSSNYVKHYVQQKLIKANVVGTPFEKLSAQEKMHITCWSASAQFNHIMRTDTGKISDEICKSLDDHIYGKDGLLFRHVLDIHETQYSDNVMNLAVMLASLPLRHAGLGLIQMQRVQQYAPLASWSFFQSTDLCKLGHTYDYLQSQGDADNPTSEIVKMLKAKVMGLAKTKETLSSHNEKSDDLPSHLTDLFKGEYKQGKMCYTTHRSIYLQLLNDINNNNDPLHIRMVNFTSGEQATFARQVPVQKFLIFDDESFQGALGAFLRLPRQGLEYLKKVYTNYCPCNAAHPQEITEEHARTCTKLGYHVRNHDSAVQELVSFMRNNGCNAYPVIRSPDGNSGKRVDAVVLNLPQRKNRMFRREAHDITICNLECTTNRIKAKGPADALLISKERSKAEKYEQDCKEKEMSFRGLAICDSGRLGPNVHALYNEVLHRHKDEWEWNDIDEENVTLSPKQWTIASPLIMWKTRMIVRIIKDRELRIQKYVQHLTTEANDLNNTFVDDICSSFVQL
jgi:hypothetical protein